MASWTASGAKSSMTALLLGVLTVTSVQQAAGSLGQSRKHASNRLGSHRRSGAETTKVRSLLSTRDPACTKPEEDPCTLTTTAIGMVESGYATYYDSDCEAKGFEGCFTDDRASCRTCYLSIDMYLASTNATASNRPLWGDCPCCVTTTLASGHVDLEVQLFDYSVFNISADACTDAPTQTPTLPPTPAPAITEAPSLPPTLPPSTPTQTNAPVVATTPAPSIAAVSTTETPAPVTGRGVVGTTAPASSTTDPAGTPAPSSAAADGAEDVGEAAVDGDEGGSSGMSTNTKIGIGVGVAAGVIFLGLAGFGALKASGKI